MNETTWKVRCPNCGAKIEFGDGGLVEYPPHWVGTPCPAWLNVDMICAHPLSLEDVIKNGPRRGRESYCMPSQIRSAAAITSSADFNRGSHSLHCFFRFFMSIRGRSA